MQFVKGHACGNDFLIVEGEPNLTQAIALCRRNTGVGADGVEYLKRSGPRSGTIRLINADGSEAEISGNGTRTVAAWLAYQSKAEVGDEIRLMTAAGARICRVMQVAGSQFLMSTGMGMPAVTPSSVTLQDGKKIEGFVVHTGNPHFVVMVPDSSFTLDGQNWREIGKAICFHPDFVAQTNVEFVHVVDSRTIMIRIFERGVGPTTSSGTGTCASAAASIHAGQTGSPLTVIAEGGSQSVEWAGAGNELFLTGPAELIAAGEAFCG